MSSDAFHIYADQDQIITTVALVNPLPKIFISQITKLLVIATPTEISLVGMSMENGMQLYSTTMRTPSDGMSIIKIVGTKAGRIFLGGSKGEVSELLYDAEEQYFKKQCRKVERSSSRWYLPFIGSSNASCKINSTHLIILYSLFIIVHD